MYTYALQKAIPEKYNIPNYVPCLASRDRNSNTAVRGT